jgi:hypothetical protein
MTSASAACCASHHVSLLSVSVQCGVWLPWLCSGMRTCFTWVRSWVGFLPPCVSCKAAWSDKANKDNLNVHRSIAQGLPHCKVYRHDMPDFAVRYLVELGNEATCNRT